MNKEGFTLAEVLITLGIIGVVAAITLPTLIAKHQKQVFYTQFRKAASQLENALKMYEIDNGCEGNISNCNIAWYDNYKIGSELSRYFKTSAKIYPNNYEKICKNYTIDNDPENLGCEPDIAAVENELSGFITTDGILFNIIADFGSGGGSIVDINGPQRGPNIIGRDIFVFYLRTNKGLVWGGNEQAFGAEDSECSESNGDGCATKLLQEGKMNY